MVDPAPSQISTLTIMSTILETRRLHTWLDETLAGLSASEQSGHTLRLCVEEAVMNTILHGYAGQAPGPIEISLWTSPPRILARIVDRAPPFDPTEAELRPPSAALQAGSLGGRGLILIRRYADPLQYEYVDGRNTVTMGFAA